MVQASPPAVGTIEDGYRFKGGDPAEQSSWEQIAPVTGPEAAGFSSLGDGWYRGPDGGSYQVGRGGAMVLRAPGTASSATPTAPSARTEDQGKSGGYARLMADAEDAYQEATSQGYDPGDFRNASAAFLEGLPFGGLDGLGAFVRDDVGDLGRQAELQWSDAQLKAVSGAASPESEVKKNVRTFFVRPGQNRETQGARTFDARSNAFRAAQIRAANAASDVSYPGAPPSGIPGPMADNGLPTYPGISARVQGVESAPLPPGGYGGGPSGPGSSPESPIDLGNLGPDELMGLRAGQYVRRADGTVYALPSAPFRDASVRQGDAREGAAVFRSQDQLTPEQRGWTPESAVAQRRDMNPIIRGADAFMRGAADTMSMEFSDEISAAADAGIGQGVGRDFGSRYGNNLRVQRAVDEADGEDMLFARRAGNVAGALVPGAGLARTALGLVRGQPLRNALRMMGVGGVTGAVAGAGAGDGTPMERAPGAAIGGVAGATVAPVATALAPRIAQPFVNAFQTAGRVVGRNVGRGMSALGIEGGEDLTERAAPSALRSGLDKFASRQNPDIAAMTARADEMEGMAMEPTFADLTDDAGRGILRANATRQTPARQAAREFADQRAEGLQDRISTQARRTISDDARSPDEIRTEVSARRAREGDAAFGAVRGEMLTPEPQIVEALRSPAGRAAIEDAAVRASNRGDIETANQLRRLGTDALDNPSGVQITVGMADRIARTLNGLGEARRGTAMAPGDNDAAASFFSLAEALRGTARRQVPGYNEALRAYGDDSRLIQATALGERFMTMEADQFAAAVARLSPEERAVAQAAARRAVERQAGTQGAAPGVAGRLSGGREQGARNAALLDDPAPMEAAMRAEREALRAAQGVNPAQGSQSSSNLQDAVQGIGDVAGAAREISTGNMPGLIGRFGRRFMSFGFSDQEAEALVTAAIDPARTREVIDMLSERMTRTEARRAVRAIRRLSVQNQAASSQTETQP